MISCGSVRPTRAGVRPRVPHPLSGVSGFTALLTVGFVLLSEAALQGWFCWGVKAGTTFEVVFVPGLSFQSLYRIGALCTCCMAVWVAAIFAF